MPKVWGAASAGNASVASNWVGGVGIATNDTMQFDATSVQDCNIDTLAGVSYCSVYMVSGYTGTVTVSWDFNGGLTLGYGATGNIVFSVASCRVSGWVQEAGNVTVNGNITYLASGVTISGGTVTGNNTAVINCSGNFTHSGGTITANTLNVTMSGAGKTLRATALRNVVISAETYWNTTSYVSSIQINTGVSLHINATKSLENSAYSSYFVNNGTIDGAGTLKLNMYSATSTLSLGVINCPLQLYALASTTVNCVLSLGANTAIGSTLDVYSSHATNTMTVSHGTNYTLNVTGTVTLGNRAIMTQGTGTWTFGAFTQNGTSSVFTQGGDITCNGAVSLTAGAFTGDAVHNFACGANVTTTSGCTILGSKVLWVFNGEGATVALHNVKHHSCTFNVNTNVTGVGYSINLSIPSGVTVTVQDGARIGCQANSMPQGWNVEGTINCVGSGLVLCVTYSGDNKIPAMNQPNIFLSVQDQNGTGDVSIVLLGDVVVNRIYFNAGSTSGNSTLNLSGFAITANIAVDILTRCIVTGTGTINAPVTVSAGTLTHTGNVTINGNLTISGGTWTGMQNATNYFSVNGNVAVDSGTVTTWTVYLKMIKSDSTISHTVDTQYYVLEIAENVSYIGTFNTLLIRYALITAANKTFTSSNNVVVITHIAGTDSLQNNGAIVTAVGKYVALMTNSDVSVNFGKITGGAIIITAYDASSVEHAVTIASISSETTSEMQITNVYSSNLVSLNLGGKTISCPVDIQAYGKVTGTGTISGNVVVSAGTLTHTGDVAINGNLTISGGTYSPSSLTYTVTLNGNFTHTSGTITTGGKMTMIKDGSTIVMATGVNFNTFTVNGNINWSCSTSTIKNLIVNSGKTLTLIENMQIYTGGDPVNVTNYGTITRTGTPSLIIVPKVSSTIFSPGIISCPLSIKTSAATSSGNLTTTLLADAMNLSSISVSSDHATFTMNLVLSGYNLSATKITIGTRGIITAGTSTITCNGDWDSTNGVFTKGTSTVIFPETCTITLGTQTGYAQFFYNLSLAFTGKTNTLISYCGITGTLTMNGGTASASSGFYVNLPNARIAGTGTWNQTASSMIYSGNGNVSINNDVVFTGTAVLGGDGTGNATVTITTDINQPTATFNIMNAVAGYTTTVSFNCGSVYCRKVQFSSTGFTVMNAGACIYNFSDNFATSSANTTFNQGSSTVIFRANATITMKEGQKLYNLNIPSGVTLTLGSNIVCQRDYDKEGTITLNGYTITVDALVPKMFNGQIAFVGIWHEAFDDNTIVNLISQIRRRL